MKKFLTLSVLFLISAALVFAGGQGETSSAPERTFVTIGTGGVTGVYYPTGGAISKSG